ncbi:helix-turn-helix transcriptional regulator [Amycolatopsis cynarae]|uniref:Helix-turn-helix transcriptional regulator n=1 Tax=Amycolatopsis cynarae TaxID=2995223 RepID=A0ABY7B350_9PSEU|nr:helix-turn-helix transcriptional regulator [Amycolatopsis sp. HUAS 11-8]WAL66735.1 helix-turn-helix transcriptional regulator [Amycolatopsis sp. HUAS 11-8]
MDELGEFLRSRRARLDPAQAGFPAGNRRRVSGLRRDEVAQLAGISVEYYIRLEQGRAGQPSHQVLTALARALGLDEVEERHLHDLAGPPAKPRPRANPARRELVDLLRRMTGIPALVTNHRLDVLAWNRLAAHLFFDFERTPAKRRNLGRFAFLDPASREIFADWPEVARATVGQLRLAAGRNPGDQALATLLGELTMNSPDFEDLWSRRDVRERTHGRKRFRHPVAGELTLRFENFVLPDASGQRLTTFTPEPESEEALALLAMWAG